MAAARRKAGGAKARSTSRREALSGVPIDAVGKIVVGFLKDGFRRVVVRRENGTCTVEATP